MCQMPLLWSWGSYRRNFYKHSVPTALMPEQALTEEIRSLQLKG